MLSVIRKVDLHVLPVFALFYLLSFLDRSNVGNAEIQGLSEDIHLHGNQYNIGLMLFYIAYSVFGMPANVMLRLLSPRLWLPSLMISWGVVTTLTGIVQNYKGFIAVRIFLGVCEAGMLPGISYVLSQWYLPHELQKRQAIFYCSASLAGAFGGILAFGLGKMDGIGNLEGWRWIFIIEGCFTVVVAAIGMPFVQNYPENARFLLIQEKQELLEKVERNVPRDDLSRRQKFKLTDLRDALADYHIYFHTLVYLSLHVVVYGFTVFLPTIIKGMGSTSSKAQLLTIPIYVVGCFCSVAIAAVADRRLWRFQALTFCLCLLFTAYIALGCVSSVEHPNAAYGVCFLIGIGIYGAIPTSIAWFANHLAGKSHKHISLGLQIGIGNLGGAISSNIYREQDKPRYKLGHFTEAGFIGLCFLSAVVIKVMEVYSSPTISKDYENTELEYDSEEKEEKEDTRVHIELS